METSDLKPEPKYYVAYLRKSNGPYIDDVGNRYHVYIISETEYLALPPKNQRIFKLHWAGLRFIELAGLTKVNP